MVKRSSSLVSATVFIRVCVCVCLASPSVWSACPRSSSKEVSYYCPHIINEHMHSDAHYHGNESTMQMVFTCSLVAPGMETFYHCHCPS